MRLRDGSEEVPFAFINAPPDPQIVGKIEGLIKSMDEKDKKHLGSSCAKKRSCEEGKDRRWRFSLKDSRSN